ncbi:MAG: HEAT repeat domain-containing protein [bacterium]
MRKEAQVDAEHERCTIEYDEKNSTFHIDCNNISRELLFRQLARRTGWIFHIESNVDDFYLSHYKGQIENSSISKAIEHIVEGSGYPFVFTKEHDLVGHRGKTHVIEISMEEKFPYTSMCKHERIFLPDNYFVRDALCNYTVEELSYPLKSEDENIVNQAIIGLQCSRDPQAVDLLLPLLKHHHQEVVMVAVSALINKAIKWGYKDKIKPYFIDTLHEREFKQKHLILPGLAKFGDDDLAPVVIPYLTDEDRTLRLAAMRALAFITADESMIDPLIKALRMAKDDDDTEAQKIILLTLGKIGTEKALSIVEKNFLTQGEDVVQYIAAKILTWESVACNERRQEMVYAAISGGDATKQRIFEVLASSSCYVEVLGKLVNAPIARNIKGRIVKALAFSGKERGLALLGEMLENENNSSTLKKQVIESFTYVEDPGAYDYIVERIKMDRHPEVRCCAVRNLVPYSINMENNLLEPLEVALYDDQETVRKEAIDVISVIGTSEYIPLLYIAMKDTNEYVSKKAKELLDLWEEKWD